MTSKKLSLSVALSTLSLLSLAVFPALADENNSSSASTASTTTIPLVVVPLDINNNAPINPSSEGSTNDLDRVTNLDTLKKKGATQIKIRLEALSKLSRRAAASKLTDAQKTQLQAEITTNVNGLTELGVKISAGSDIVAVRALVKSIYTDFRIFAVFIPRINGLMHVWLSLANIERVTLSLAETQTKIDALKDEGVDTSKMEKVMAEVKTSLGTAKTKLEAAAVTLSNIKPADYPGSNETFRRVRTIIREAQKQITKARQSVHRLNALIRLANQAEARKLKLLERRDKNKERKDEHKEDREEVKEKKAELKDAIKTLRENFKQDIQRLKTTSSTR